MPLKARAIRHKKDLSHSSSSQPKIGHPFGRKPVRPLKKTSPKRKTKSKTSRSMTKKTAPRPKRVTRKSKSKSKTSKKTNFMNPKKNKYGFAPAYKPKVAKQSDGSKQRPMAKGSSDAFTIKNLQSFLETNNQFAKVYHIAIKIKLLLKDDRGTWSFKKHRVVPNLFTTDSVEMIVGKLKSYYNKNYPFGAQDPRDMQFSIYFYQISSAATITGLEDGSIIKVGRAVQYPSYSAFRLAP